MNEGEEDYIDDAFDDQEDAKRASANARPGQQRHDTVDKEVEQLAMKKPASGRGVANQAKPQSGYALPGDEEEDEDEGVGLGVDVDVDVDDDDEDEDEEEVENQDDGEDE